MFFVVVEQETPAGLWAQEIRIVEFRAFGVGGSWV